MSAPRGETRWSSFSDDEIGALAAGIWGAEGEGMFDPDSELWREIFDECRNRDLTVRLWGYDIVKADTSGGS